MISGDKLPLDGGVGPCSRTWRNTLVLGKCKSFLLQCSLVFGQRPCTYATDEAKISYLVGLLRGNALAWATAVWESQTAQLDYFPSFCAEFRWVFEHPVQGMDVSKWEYSVKFRIIAAESGWNNAALQGAFCWPDCYDNLISLRG